MLRQEIVVTAIVDYNIQNAWFQQVEVLSNSEIVINKLLDENFPDWYCNVEILQYKVTN